MNSTVTTMDPITKTRISRTKQEHLRATARRCRGRTLVVSREGDAFATALRRAEADPEVVDRPAPLPEGPFRTVLIAGMLEFLDEATGNRLLETALGRLEDGGRLVVSVPNEKSITDPGQKRWFSRKTLRRTLRPLGKVDVATDQPYRWLTMTVWTTVAGKSIDRVKRNRFRATSRLCRGKVLELGCGEGHLTRAIRDRGCEVLGVDLSRDRLARARRFYPDLNFVRADILEFETDVRYDTAVLAEVLEHVDEPTGEAMLQKAWSLLAPGGRLVVSVPNEDLVPHPNHVREFTRKSLKKLLSRWGRPKLVTHQPFKWLMMIVEKRS